MRARTHACLYVCVCVCVCVCVMAVCTAAAKRFRCSVAAIKPAALWYPKMPCIVENIINAGTSLWSLVPCESLEKSHTLRRGESRH